jgi:DNA-binding MarR family transcriptional regulator
MQLGDLVKPLDKMSDEELIEQLRKIKQRRTVERPAYKAHLEKAGKPKIRKAASLLEGLSEEDRKALIEQLQQGELDV